MKKLARSDCNSEGGLTALRAMCVHLNLSPAYIVIKQPGCPIFYEKKKKKKTFLLACHAGDVDAHLNLPTVNSK